MKKILPLDEDKQKIKRKLLKRYLLSYAISIKYSQKKTKKKLKNSNKLKTQWQKFKWPKIKYCKITIKDAKKSTIKILKIIKKFKKKTIYYKKQIKNVLKKIKRTNLYQLFSEILVSFKLTFKNYGFYAIAIVAISAIIFSGTYLIYNEIFKNLPSPYDLTKIEPVVSTKILDRNGKILFRIYKDENRTIVPLSAIPKSLINATIAIEDKDFYSHQGFSIRGISRAIISNIKGEKLQGGSTLTQQLVKNRLLTPKKTFSRKLREFLLAILVEGVYTKDQILEMYLNQVSYGGSTYGAEEAAQKYFGKSVSKLTLAESAILAGLPAAPSAYTPFGPNPELAFARQEEVLRRMVEDGYISNNSAERAKRQTLIFNNNKIDIKAPHFVMYVKKILAQQYGEDLLNKGGLEVRTTLDLDVQKQAENIVYNEIKNLKRLRVSNGATMVTNPQTGEILAMVGSADYFDFKNDGQVNVTLRPRQPGSSIKPINYALSLSNGKSPSSIINDSPITYYSLGSKPYSPKNYDGKYHGKVTIREALASSYNIPAVKSLAENGISNMIDLAEEMGISTWKDRSRFGLSLTLGGGEVTMIDMTEAYGTFATGGYHVKANPILEVRDYKGKIYYQNNCVLNGENCLGERVLKKGVAYLISNILSDNTARTPAFGPISTLNIPNQQVAVKTGTTNNLRDNWTFGYTSNRLVSVWVGNNDNTSMSYVASGVTGASPIWNKIMRTQLSEENPHKFVMPDNIVRAPVCISTNKRVKQDYFIKGMEPTNYCPLPKPPIKNKNE